MNVCLKLIPPEDQIIKPEWIQYYKYVPDVEGKDFCGFFVFIDPAFSESRKADYTAMVVMAVYWNKTTKKPIAYVAEVVNRRMSLPKSISECKRINDQLLNLFDCNQLLLSRVAVGLHSDKCWKEKN